MKMETPKMDVVRFQEADVIVASGDAHKYLNISGLGVDGEATWTYTNGHTSVRSISDYADDKGNGTLVTGVKFYNANDVAVTLGEIVEGGDADGLYADYNGDYETFDSGSSWKWRVTQ